MVGKVIRLVSLCHVLCQYENCIKFHNSVFQGYENGVYETPKSCSQVGVRTHSHHWDGSHWVAGVDFQVRIFIKSIKAFAEHEIHFSCVKNTEFT